MAVMTGGVGAPWRVFQFVHDWAERPFFRGPGEGQYGPGHFQGRAYELEQLKQFFVDGSGGTVLVSGYRGVGKTATVDRALIDALAAIDIENGPQPDGKDRQSLRDYWLGNREPPSEATLARLRPKQLIALKLDFGQIATLRPARATARAGQEPSANADTAQPPVSKARGAEVDPRQVLIEIIKGLHRNLVDGRRSLPGERHAVEQLAQLRAKVALAQKPGLHFAVLRLVRAHTLARFFRPHQRDFWSHLTEALNVALMRAYYQTYREEHAQGISHEFTSGVSSKLTFDVKKLVTLALASVLVGVGVWYGLSTLPVFNAISSWAPLASGFVSLVGLAGSVNVSTSRTVKSTDASKVVYSRDSSLPSLKRDLEEIISLLESNEAPIEFRLVVVVDELDKLDDVSMLDGVIQSFKNLFTLNRCTFVFVTDKNYYDHITQQQQVAAKSHTYAPQHTFFTRKVFLTKPDFDDVKQYLDTINGDLKSTGLNNPEWQEDWTQTVRYLTFASRCHYFDLLSLLNELVQANPPPTLELKYERLGRVELRRNAHFQRMVELVYRQYRYRGPLQSDANNRLLAELYGVFDTAQDQPASNGRANGRTDGQPHLVISAEEKATQRKAKHQLLKLLVDCGAIAPLNGAERTTPQWKGGLFREPQPDDLDLVERRQQALTDLETMVRGWTTIERMLAGA